MKEESWYMQTQKRRRRAARLEGARAALVEVIARFRGTGYLDTHMDTEAVAQDIANLLERVDEAKQCY